MSPIGRVFIVLNLILAGAFVGFAGTHLQKQFHWKTEAENRGEELAKVTAERAADIDRLGNQLSTMTTSKSVIEQQLGQAQRENQTLRDEIGTLNTRNSENEGHLKKLASVIEGIGTQAQSAFDQSKAAYQAQIAAETVKDGAIRAKDAAESENRALKNQIASLNETVEQRDLQLAGLGQDNREKQLLIDVAKQYGFLESMAVPRLAGTVSVVTGNLCTLLITENPNNAELKPGYKFAIYDEESGYKAEARVTNVDSERNAVFCTFDLKTGEVMPGDRASTHLTGL